MARGMKFIGWNLDRLVDQVRSVCQVDDATGCWIWNYGSGPRDYPDIMIQRQRKNVSRWLLEITTGTSGEVARHSCDRPACCNPEHLLWGSQLENVRDAFERGRRLHKAARAVQPRRAPRLARGERHGLARLTEKDVLMIRARHMGGESVYRLAKELGVSKGTVKSVLTGRTWSHVQDAA